jgi:hypothetical protein
MNTDPTDELEQDIEQLCRQKVVCIYGYSYPLYLHRFMIAAYIFF